MSHQRDRLFVGEVKTICPTCSEEIPIPVYAEILGNLGTQNIITEADTDPLWLHYEGHSDIPPEPTDQEIITRLQNRIDRARNYLRGLPGASVNKIWPAVEILEEDNS